MTHSDSWGTMWSARLLLLSWALLLIPEPGASQIGPQYKICNDCPKPKSYEDPEWFQKTIDGGVNRYIKCPHSSVIKFPLKKGQLVCALNSVPWVKELMKCIDGDKKCLTEGSSTSQKDFSKGNNEKPSTTTTVPTTAPATSMEPSTPRKDDNIGQSTEPAKQAATTPAASPEAPNDSTSQQGSNKEINLPQGDDKPSENHEENVDGKMRHMKISIISLVGIVLVLVAVSVGLYCRKKKTSNLNLHCGNGSVKYMSAPDLDSVNTET